MPPHHVQGGLQSSVCLCLNKMRRSGGKWATLETVLVLSVLFFHWLNSLFLTLDWVGVCMGVFGWVMSIAPAGPVARPI